MRSNYIGIERNVEQYSVHPLTLNKPLEFNNCSKEYHDVKIHHNASSTEDFNAQRQKDLCQNKNQLRYAAMSIYDNCNTEAKFDFERENPRKSRQQIQIDEKNLSRNKVQIKRDHSMPPISFRERNYGEDNLFSHYPLTSTKCFIDSDQKTSDISDDNLTDMYDSVITNVSITPPPVNMIHEYANRKAIIRPIAFRPVQSDRSRHESESSPTKRSVLIKKKTSQVKRTSPPPVPPHGNRGQKKSGLVRVQSLRSAGDSSGYYSSSGRAVYPANGNISSSTDVSPLYDDSGSIVDSTVTAAMGNIYVNTAELLGDYHGMESPEHRFLASKCSLEAEISAERERNNFLETALSKSSDKLISAESQINELRAQLVQKCSEIGSTKENLALCKHSLEYQSARTHSLEKSIQSIKYEHCKTKMLSDKVTQTAVYNGDYGPSALLEQFDEERRTWLDEKLKVLTYQRQIESNFQRLVIKSRYLKSQLAQLKSQFKDPSNWSQQPYPLYHSDDNENISRAESTEQYQASF